MKFSVILLSNVLFATTILAAPRGRGLEERVARRAANTRLTHPLIPVAPPSTTIEEGPLDDNATHVQYSSNWAGAVLTAPPAGQTFNAVSAQFTVPTPSVPSGGSSSGSYSASAWVGIDGDTYGAAILQSGIDFTISGGRVSYDAWYEWYPNYAIDFSGMTMSAGNVISVSVTSTSASAGNVVLENLSTGKTVTQKLSAPSSSSHLGGQNAEWIVEDYESGSSLVSLANFGTVTFTNCVAKTNSESLGTSGATIIEIESSSNQVLTGVSVPSSSQVKVVYQ
ncbi:hypothetical protein MMC14_009245 [Varicellaria rhodocarpa]|nr:hypothetical protein [Varicellaria rhodocarpa]